MPILIYFKKRYMKNYKAQSTIEYLAILFAVTIATILLVVWGSHSNDAVGISLIRNISNSAANITDKASEVLTNQDKFFGRGDPFDYTDSSQYPEPWGCKQ